MLKKIIAGLMLLASLSFGMSLSKLNGATKAELMEINGVGEVKAAEIIKQRRKGKFKSFADLQERVDGIGEQTADNIKRDVKVADDVKKVKKTTKKTMKPAAKKEMKKKKSKKRKTAKTETEEKAKKSRAKTKKKMTKTKTKADKPKKKKHKVKSTEEKKKELKKKPRKTKIKKTKKTETKKKN